MVICIDPDPPLPNTAFIVFDDTTVNEAAAKLPNVTEVAVRKFVPQRAGTIINIASVTALLPEAFEPIYAATKAYILALSQAIASETAHANVRVQVVLPGVTRTEIWGDRVEVWSSFLRKQ